MAGPPFIVSGFQLPIYTLDLDVWSATADWYLEQSNLVRAKAALSVVACRDRLLKYYYLAQWDVTMRSVCIGDLSLGYAKTNRIKRTPWNPPGYYIQYIIPDFDLLKDYPGLILPYQRMIWKWYRGIISRGK